MLKSILNRFQRIFNNYDDNGTLELHETYRICRKHIYWWTRVRTNGDIHCDRCCTIRFENGENSQETYNKYTLFVIIVICYSSATSVLFHYLTASIDATSCILVLLTRAYILNVRVFVALDMITILQQFNNNISSYRCMCTWTIVFRRLILIDLFGTNKYYIILWRNVLFETVKKENTNRLVAIIRH